MRAPESPAERHGVAIPTPGPGEAENGTQSVGSGRLVGAPSEPSCPTCGVTLVGSAEIAQALEVRITTVQQWRARRIFPPPAFTVSGTPVWEWRVVEEWARETGRL